MSNQRRVDIYDCYALPRLLDQTHGDFWHTLKWVGEQLAAHGAVGERPEVLIRGIVTNNSGCPDLQPVLRDRRVASGLAQRLRDVADDLTQASHAAFSIDVRIENAAANWFHGRYLVLNNRWVVSSDRGFDFLTERRGIASCRSNEVSAVVSQAVPQDAAVGSLLGPGRDALGSAVLADITYIIGSYQRDGEGFHNAGDGPRRLDRAIAAPPPSMAIPALTIA